MAQAERSPTTPMPRFQPGDLLRTTPGCAVGCRVCTVKCAVATAVRDQLAREWQRLADQLADAEAVVRTVSPAAADAVLH